MGRRLHTDQQPGLFLDPPKVGFKNVEVGVTLVVAGVEIDVRDSGTLARGAHNLQHLLYRFLRGIVGAEIVAGERRPGGGPPISVASDVARSGSLSVITNPPLPMLATSMYG